MKKVNAIHFIKYPTFLFSIVLNQLYLCKKNLFYQLLNFFLKTSLDYRGHPLTQNSLTRFPLPWFLAYVRVRGELALVGDHSTVPLTRISCNTVFSKYQNVHKAVTLCIVRYACHHNLLLIRNPSWILIIYQDRIFWKQINWPLKRGKKYKNPTKGR